MSASQSNMPEGWQEVKLGDVCLLNPTEDIQDFNGDFLKMEDVTENGQIKNVSYIEKSKASGGFSKFRNGDSLIAKITPCFENRKGAFVNNIKGLGLGSTEFFVLRPGRLLYPDFLYLVTRSETFFIHGEVSMQGSGGQRRVPSTFIKAFPILLPPLPEQKKIATILSAWDDSIATLGKLLAAKQQQKRGLAEELLTGKRRLKGFVGEWEEKKLIEMAVRTKGRIVPTNEKGLGVPYIGAKSFSGRFEGYTEDKKAILCHADDVLILWDGENAGNSTTGLEGAVSSTVARLRLSTKLNAVFLQAVLQKDLQIIRDSRTGSGIPHMPSDFEQWFTIPLPPLPEQQAIASILSTLDDEILALTRLRAALQQQKRGLMDVLLTGRVRVPLSADL